MVLPITEALTTPCLTSSMNPVVRKKLKEQYRKAKRVGLVSAWGVVTGAGVLEIALAYAKGEVVKHGKKKAASLAILGCSHVGLGLVPYVTNSTRIIKYVKKAHSVTSCIYRCAHDASEIPLVALDFLVFGEYVPSCPDDGYQLLNVSSDALTSLDD